MMTRLTCLQRALQPLKRKLSSRALPLCGELDQSEAQGLLEHALLAIARRFSYDAV